MQLRAGIPRISRKGAGDAEERKGGTKGRRSSFDGLTSGLGPCSVHQGWSRADNFALFAVLGAFA